MNRAFCTEGTYEAPIAQGGTNVSGGQKQRLSIARAIAKHPQIYLFDDSFSALDYKTDVIDSLQALWNRYSVQIQYYEEALTKLMQLPVKERILYSFYLEKYE